MDNTKQVSASVRGLMDFLQNSPTAFHAVDQVRRILLAQGFRELPESQRWILLPGGKYFTTRNGSSLIAFRVGARLREPGFLITASHSDSPCFKLKQNAELRVRDRYVQLNTEGYGGMICSSWMDRPLSLAGRVLLRKVEDGRQTHESRLVCFDRDLLLIPNLAIHMNRKVNEGFAFNKQILAMDLYLYNRMAPTVWGAQNEFLSAGRLDDLECAYGTLQGFLAGENDRHIQVYSLFDNEEVGSGTKQGAASTLLKDVLYRVVRGLGLDDEDFRCMTARSFMLSCDNAHAVHPNHPEKTDANNCTYMNEGIVVKSHAGQKYTSDARSIALFRAICEHAQVPVQFFSNRSDEAGGSTLGNIAMAQVSMNTVDLGLAQLAMHSAYETAGVRDLEYLERACAAFYGAGLSTDERGDLRLEG